MGSRSINRVMLLVAVICASVVPGTVVTAQESSPVAPPAASPVASQSAELVDADCPFPAEIVPPNLSAGDNLTCGTLEVPADHADPESSDTYELAVATIASTSDDPAPEPLIVLSGGPGQGALDLLPVFSDALPADGPAASWSAFLAYQDVVIIDQRGTGYSEPEMVCPAEVELQAQALEGATPAAMPSGFADLYADCGAALAASGIDLETITTAQNAADIDSLRGALGVEQVDLFGSSYGSWLALEVMRDFPASVHSALLNSPAPPQVNLFGGQLIGFQAALDTTFAGCAADPVCDAANPDLATALADAVERLETEPLIVTVEDPATGQRVDFPVDAPTFVGLVYITQFVGPFAPTTPSLITSVAAGDDTVLSDLLPILFTTSSGLNMPMFFATICQDEAPFTSREAIETQARAAGVTEEIIAYAGESRGGDLFEVCAAWDLEPSDPVANEPVASDVPTLIMTGLIDPITPSPYGEVLMETLPNATEVESPIAGHDPLTTSGACGMEIATAFLADPAAPVDASCFEGQSIDFSPGGGGATPVASPAATPVG